MFFYTSSKLLRDLNTGFLNSQKPNKDKKNTGYLPRNQRHKKSSSFTYRRDIADIAPMSAKPIECGREGRRKKKDYG